MKYFEFLPPDPCTCILTVNGLSTSDFLTMALQCFYSLLHRNVGDGDANSHDILKQHL